MSDGILSAPVGPDDHHLGPADAPVVLVEYGDYECPHCGRAHAVIQTVLAKLGDEVRFVFRNFPLAATATGAIHRHSRTRCEPPPGPACARPWAKAPRSRPRL